MMVLSESRNVLLCLQLSFCTCVGIDVIWNVATMVSFTKIWATNYHPTFFQWNLDWTELVSNLQLFKWEENVEMLKALEIEFVYGM